MNIFGKMENDRVKYMNILLLGETGNGKSTLINAFANYMTYRSFDEAKNGEEICLIPAKFSYFDEDCNETQVTAGQNDPNECLETGQSATLACQSYTFPITENVSVRWIDSSGFGATQGIDFDDESVDDIVHYISKYKTLHAIAVVVKAKQTGLSPQFPHCMSQIMSRLDVRDNIIIIFTHCRRPDGILKVVKNIFSSIADDLQIGNVQLTKNNMFYFENEPFRNLLAIKRNVTFNETEIKVNNKTWAKTSEEYQRLLKFLNEKQPYHVQVVKIQVLKFAENVSLIIDNILRNIELNRAKLSQSEVNSGVQITINNVNIVSFKNKIIVCRSKSCVESVTKRHPQICCWGCQSVHRKTKLCQHLKSGKCAVCKCESKHHEKLSFDTKTEEQSFSSGGINENNVDSYLDMLDTEERVIVDSLGLIVGYLKSLEQSKDKRTRTRELKLVKTLEKAVERKKTLNTSAQIGAEEILNVMKGLEGLQLYGQMFSTVCKVGKAKVSDKNKNTRDVFVKIKNKVFR